MKSEIRNPKSEMPAVGVFRSAETFSAVWRGVFVLRASGLVRISDFGFRISAVLAVLFVPSVAQACSVCFGASDSKLTAGMLAGVLVLLLVVLSVLGGVVAFFIYLARRSSETAALETNPNESKA